MRSSPAFDATPLDLPAVAAVDRWSAVLVCVATTYAAWTFGRLDLGAVALCVGVGGVAVLAVQRALWTRSRRSARTRLVRAADGRVWLERNDQPVAPVAAGVAARLLGPSVFLDVHSADAGVRWRYRRWLTPLDADRATLRRWTVVLPRAGRRRGT